MTTQIIKELEELSDNLFKNLSLDADIKVTEVDGDEKSFKVSIDAPNESGLLIGSHGATLSSIEFFLSVSLRQKLDEWYRVIVDVGDWRAKHEDYLEGIAKQAAARARSTGEAQHLYNLTPSQRRVIHMSLSKEEGVVTESVGEGEMRYLVVKPSEASS